MSCAYIKFRAEHRLGAELAGPSVNGDVHWCKTPVGGPSRTSHKTVLSLETPPWVARLTADELETPQIRKVWELKPHPGYQEFCEDGQWGFAKKKGK